MKLKKNLKGITDVESWKNIAPPKEKDRQWKPGRSAQCLAEYITKNLPAVPDEIEQVLRNFTDKDASFDWKAEYETALPGRGGGRNHDMLMVGDDLIVGIEAKADEPFGNLIKKEICGASENKLHRISKLLSMFFKGDFELYGELRYQLLTAAAGTILEAQNKGVKKALVLVLVFKTDKTSPEKIKENNEDADKFLDAVGAVKYPDYYEIPNNTDVKLYFRKIEL